MHARRQAPGAREGRAGWPGRAPASGGDLPVRYPAIRDDLSSLVRARQDKAGSLKLAATDDRAAAVGGRRSWRGGGVNRTDMAVVDEGELATTWAGVRAVAVVGSSALLTLIQATCADGDEVVFAWRSFEAYPILARVAGAVPVAVPLDADHRHDLDAMAAAITDRTRLVFVCNPNNPSGTTVTADEFEAFLAKVPEDVVVALDEAYIEFVDADHAAGTPNAVEAMKRHRNVVGLRTFSKVYGLAGLRVGYLFGDAELVEGVNKVCIPFSVALAQVAAVESLRAEAERATASPASATNGARHRRHQRAAGAGSCPSGPTSGCRALPRLAGAVLSDADAADSTSFATFLAGAGILVGASPARRRITVTDTRKTPARGPGPLGLAALLVVLDRCSCSSRSSLTSGARTAPGATGLSTQEAPRHGRRWRRRCRRSCRPVVGGVPGGRRWPRRPRRRDDPNWRMSSRAVRAPAALEPGAGVSPSP